MRIETLVVVVLGALLAASAPAEETDRLHAWTDRSGFTSPATFPARPFASRRRAVPAGKPSSGHHPCRRSSSANPAPQSSSAAVPGSGIAEASDTLSIVK